LKFEGIRIELNVEEAQQIVEAGGGNRIQEEIATILAVHLDGHRPAPEGIATVGVLRRRTLSAGGIKRALPKPAPERERLECSWCGKEFIYPGWLRQHRKHCPKRPADEDN
jgi:hypothetical protein